MYLPLICLFTAMDHTSTSPHQESHQSNLMRLLIHENRGARVSNEFQRGFWAYINNGLGLNTDSCSWRGVECTANKITSFCMTRVEFKEANAHVARAWYVSMDFFPPSVQYIHLNSIRMVNGWLSERLPRDLRYMCLQFSFLPSFHSADRRQINLQKLPSRMEELHSISGWYSGTLMLDALPATMSLISIRNSRADFPSAYVDNQKLPAGLKCINFLGMSANFRLIEISGKKVDERLKHNKALVVQKSSRREEFNVQVKDYILHFNDSARSKHYAAQLNHT